eukprot:tig00020710_g13287.t2
MQGADREGAGARALALALGGVVCLLRNPEWAKPFAALGVVAAGPPEALGASFLYRAALTPGGRELALLRGRPRPGLAASTLHPQDTLRPLEPEGERRAREARHPAPRPACLQRPLEPEGERRAREARHPAPRPARLQVRCSGGWSRRGSGGPGRPGTPPRAPPASRSVPDGAGRVFRYPV